MNQDRMNHHKNFSIMFDVLFVIDEHVVLVYLIENHQLFQNHHNHLKQFENKIKMNIYISNKPRSILTINGDCSAF